VLYRFCIFFVLLLALGAPAAWASDTRVNAAGGLGLVMDDEAYEVNPFVAGNPAGLACLAPQTRLDAAVQWFGENESADNFQRNYYGTLGLLGNDTVNYNGFICFPTGRWALQADADYLYTEGADNLGLQTQGINRSRELLRTAYDFGPVALGAEVAPAQTSIPLPGQAAFNGQIQSGQDESSSWSVRTGLLARFPSDPGPQEDRLEVGGVYDLQPQAPRQTVSLSFVPQGSLAPSPVTLTFTNTTYQVFGPEAYYGSPGRLQAAVVTRFTNYAASEQTDSSNPSLAVPAFQAAKGSNALLTGIVKGSYPLPEGLRLKSGALFSYYSSQENTFDQGGNPVSVQNGQAWQAEAGAGVEKPGDFTWGAQALFLDVTGTTLDPSGDNLGNTDYQSLTVSVGGEKWLSPQWAFRMGLQYQNQNTGGTQPYTTFYLPGIAPGVQLETGTLIAGAGFKDKDFYGDLALSYGQPVRDNSATNAFANQENVQLAAGIRFN
jgi:hypothetical protein